MSLLGGFAYRQSVKIHSIPINGRCGNACAKLERRQAASLAYRQSCVIQSTPTTDGRVAPSPMRNNVWWANYPTDGVWEFTPPTILAVGRRRHLDGAAAGGGISLPPVCGYAEKPHTQAVWKFLRLVGGGGPGGCCAQPSFCERPKYRLDRRRGNACA